MQLLSIGHALMDCLIKGLDYNHAKQITPHDFPKQYSKYLVGVHVGGAPANVAAYFNLLGGSANLLTIVGDDEFGAQIKSQLSNLDVKLAIPRPGAFTDIALILLEQDSHHFVKFLWGSINHLHPGDIAEALSNKVDIIYFTPMDCVHESFKLSIEKALRIAKARGIVVAVDVNLRPAAFHTNEEMYTTSFEAVKEADIIKMNASELMYFGFKHGLILRKLNFSNFIEVCKGVYSILSPKLMLVTLSAVGAIALTESSIEWHSTYDYGKPVSSVGAGDAFMAAALYKTLADMPRFQEKTKDILEFACKIASIKVLFPETIVERVGNHKKYSDAPSTSSYSEFVRAVEGILPKEVEELNRLLKD
ncbi:hypothetical protein DRJ48_05400 [Candidatus Woesearchaeota archaeon]|nr:MAG: hypothetical protein DRJ48_05400 [Candidatus Woesearchaeota archaeon]